MNLGKAIAIIREKRSLKQAELAEKVQITKAAMSHIETGKSWPSQENLKKIAEVLQVEPEYILLVAINPDKDMDAEKSAKFNELFPNFSEALLSFI